MTLNALNIYTLVFVNKNNCPDESNASDAFEGFNKTSFDNNYGTAHVEDPNIIIIDIINYEMSRSRLVLYKHTPVHRSD